MQPLLAPTNQERRNEGRDSPFDLDWKVQAEISEEELTELKKISREVESRLILGHTPGKYPGYTDLLAFLRSHLQDSFLTLQAMQKGFFRLEFADAEGATNCLLNTALVWGGRIVKFTRWRTGFSAEAPHSESHMGHNIRVQLPDLDPPLQDEKWLRRLGGVIGEVIKVEDKSTPLKRPAGPIIHIHVSSIDKLPGYLLVPNISNEAGTGQMREQKVFYSGLPDQCNRCRQFGHQSGDCNLSRYKKPPNKGTEQPKNLAGDKGKQKQKVTDYYAPPNREEPSGEATNSGGIKKKRKAKKKKEKSDRKAKSGEIPVLDNPFAALNISDTIGPREENPFKETEATVKLIGQEKETLQEIPWVRPVKNQSKYTKSTTMKAKVLMDTTSTPELGKEPEEEERGEISTSPSSSRKETSEGEDLELEATLQEPENPKIQPSDHSEEAMQQEIDLQLQEVPNIDTAPKTGEPLTIEEEADQRGCPSTDTGPPRWTHLSISQLPPEPDIQSQLERGTHTQLPSNVEGQEAEYIPQLIKGRFWEAPDEEEDAGVTTETGRISSNIPVTFWQAFCKEEFRIPFSAEPVPNSHTTHLTIWPVFYKGRSLKSFLLIKQGKSPMLMDPVVIAVADRDWTMITTRRAVIQQIQQHLVKKFPNLVYTLTNWTDGEWHSRWDTKQGVSELTMTIMIRVARKTASPQNQSYHWYTPPQIPTMAVWNGREAANLLFASVAGLIPDAPLPDSWKPGRHASPTGSTGKRQKYTNSEFSKDTTSEQ